MPRITPNLWFDTEEAANLYVSVFETRRTAARGPGS